LEDNIQSFKNLTNKNKEIIETLEADCDNFRVENDKLKKEIHKLKESIVIQEKRLLVSQHVICCNEETIDILRKQNKQDNLRYNNLFKLLENLKG
jgi:stress response protein SCP2